MSDRRARRAAFVAVAALTLLAAGLRAPGLSERPFWRDEAWVAAALEARAGGQEAGANLPVPPLYGLACRLCDRWLDPPELALRLPALLAGIALVPASYAASRGLRLPRTLALAGSAACCVSFALVVWSRELKQYEMEALLGVLLAGVVFRIRTGARRRGAGCVHAAVISLCAVGPWLGYGFVLIAGPLLATLLLPRPTGHDRRQRFVAAGLGGAALALSAALLLIGPASRQASDPSLRAYVSAWFVDPLSLVSLGRAAKYTVAVLAVAFVPVDLAPGVIEMAFAALFTLGLAIAGLLSWPRRTRPAAAVWAAGPWLAMLVAALLHVYPYGIVRMSLFLLPPLVILSGVGLVGVGRRIAVMLTGRGGAVLLAGPVVIVAAALPFIPRVALQNRYWVFHDYPGLLRELKQRRRPQEIVVVSLQAAPGVEYYADDLAGFVVTPAVGTLGVHGLDYDKWYRERLSPADAPFWLVTDDPLPNQALIDLLEDWRFRLDLRVTIGEESPFGNARLYRVVAR